MHHLQNASYRTLELVCRRQAAISSTTQARILLEDMAAEYRKLADFVERQSQPVPRERIGVPTLAV
jgi:hypothetical protein